MTLDFRFMDHWMKQARASGIQAFVWFLGGVPYGYPRTLSIEREIYIALHEGEKPSQGTLRRVHPGGGHAGAPRPDAAGGRAVLPPVGPRGVEAFPGQRLARTDHDAVRRGSHVGPGSLPHAGRAART